VLCPSAPSRTHPLHLLSGIEFFSHLQTPPIYDTKNYLTKFRIKLNHPHYTIYNKSFHMKHEQSEKSHNRTCTITSM
jgi:hypothetical protein